MNAALTIAPVLIPLTPMFLPEKLSHSEMQFFLDALIHFAFGEFLGYANGILDCVHIRPSMADNADAAHTQERRAAVLGIVDALLEFAECALREHCPDFGGDRRFKRLLQQG